MEEGHNRGFAMTDSWSFKRKIFAITFASFLLVAAIVPLAAQVRTDSQGKTYRSRRPIIKAGARSR